MGQPQPSSAPAPFPDPQGTGRGASLPRDPGRATELLYRRHGATVFRFAWHLLGRREDAEDAAQATFLAVHGSLTHGTAVLEPRAWVLRIARNECMGRLRTRARQPTLAALDAIELPAAGGVERSAELRDEIRVARSTLGGLPAEEREAFVLREWLGLEAREAALALGLSAVAVDGLAGRARRSLVLAVGGLEAPAGCSGTRTALESGSLDRAVRVHLLRCPTCRGVRRALRPPEETVGRLVPVGVIAERLADALPGFATGGGGIIAALTAKAAAAPFAAKTAALLAAALVTAGVAKQEVVDTGHHARRVALAPARGGEARSVRPAPVVAARRTTVVRPPATSSSATAHTAIVAFEAPRPPRTTAVRGGVALDDRRHGGGTGDATEHRRSGTSGHGGGPDSKGGSDDGSHGATQPGASTATEDGGSESGDDGGSQGTRTSHGTIGPGVTTGTTTTSSGTRSGGHHSSGSDGSDGGSGSGGSGTGGGSGSGGGTGSGGATGSGGGTGSGGATGSGGGTGSGGASSGDGAGSGSSGSGGGVSPATPGAATSD